MSFQTEGSRIILSQLFNHHKIGRKDTKFTPHHNFLQTFYRLNNWWFTRQKRLRKQYDNFGASINLERLEAEKRAKNKLLWALQHCWWKHQTIRNPLVLALGTNTCRINGFKIHFTVESFQLFCAGIDIALSRGLR